MSHYLLTTPVEAVRYRRGSNEQDVARLVRGPSGRGSYNNQQGFLHFYNDGPEVNVHDGDWVVRVAGAVLVLVDADFSEHFVVE